MAAIDDQIMALGRARDSRVISRQAALSTASLYSSWQRSTQCVKIHAVYVRGTMTISKHPGGRPTLYRREMYDRLIEAMAEGLTAEAAAARIGIPAHRWKQERNKIGRNLIFERGRR
jgi:hypothetical protein